MDFGERVRELRSRRGWSLDDLAERTGLSKGYLSRLETGKRSQSAGAIQRLSQAFSLPEYLLIHPTAPIDRLHEISEILEQMADLNADQIDSISRMIRAMRSS